METPAITHEEILFLGFTEIEGTDHYATGGLEATTPNYVLNHGEEEEDYKLEMGWCGDFTLYKSVQTHIKNPESVYKLHKNEYPLMPYYWVPFYSGRIPSIEFLKALLENTKVN